MLYKNFFFTTFVIFLLLACACAFADTLRSSIFWRVIDENDRHHYVFGTIHIDDNRVTNFHSNVINSIKNSDIFFSETNDLKDYSILEDKQNRMISTYLSQEEQEKLNERVNFHSIPYDFALNLKPWLLAIIINSPEPATPFIQDNMLKSIAQDNLISTEGLDNLEDHYSALDSLTYDDQINFLKLAINFNDDQRRHDFEALVVAYLNQDPKQILVMNQKSLQDGVSSEVIDVLLTKLLYERNIRFTQMIEKTMLDKKLFIAVGASHLSGDSGLLNFFRKKGYKLEPLEAFQ